VEPQEPVIVATNVFVSAASAAETCWTETALFSSASDLIASHAALLV
jgi:hypothetical protein